VPILTLSKHADAPVEEVWKLLHDPTRFPDWWVGIETVRTDTDDEYTIWPSGYPDFPMPQRLGTSRVEGRVTISCLVSDLEYRWQLRAGGETTEIEVQLTLPDAEAHRLEAQRVCLGESLGRLAQLSVTEGH
jgi:uncharacterized protein YndB with AHSA1/START domain